MSDGKTFQKKPIRVQAFRWGIDEAPEWWIDRSENFAFKDGSVFVITNHGPAEAKQGDYIIRGIEGEIYPCGAEIFEASYDEVQNEQ
jgi:hypothetical protein